MKTQATNIAVAIERAGGKQPYPFVVYEGELTEERESLTVDPSTQSAQWLLRHFMSIDGKPGRNIDPSIGCFSQLMGAIAGTVWDYVLELPPFVSEDDPDDVQEVEESLYFDVVAYQKGDDTTTKYFDVFFPSDVPMQRRFDICARTDLLPEVREYFGHVDLTVIKTIQCPMQTPMDVWCYNHLRNLLQLGGDNTNSDFLDLLEDVANTTNTLALRMKEKKDS